MRIVKEITEDKLIFSRRALPSGMLHWHEQVEICRMISGEAYFTVGSIKYHFLPGDIITVQSRELHLYEALKDSFVNLGLIPVREHTVHMRSLPMLPPYISGARILEVPFLGEQIDQTFDQMKAEAENVKPYCEERLILLTLSLWCLLARHFQTDTEIRYKHRNLLQPVLDRINQDCSEKYTLSSLAGQLGYTPEYLSVVFHECVGIGFKEYLDNQRINMAKRLLLTSDDLIANIALKCGFENVRTFNNRFKSLTQMTPGEFIKRYREKM